MKIKHVSFACLVCSLLSVSAFGAHAMPTKNACKQTPVAVQVLGSGGPEMNDGRASSSYLIWHRGKAKVLIDAGGGSALRFEQSGARIEDLDAIVFTHLHVDHSADFPALVKAAFFTNRRRDLPVFGPEGNNLLPSMTAFTQALFGSGGAWPYLSDYLPGSDSGSFKLRPVTVTKDQDTPKTVFDEKGIQLASISTHHGPLPALAWRIRIDGKVISFSGDMNGDFHSLEKLAKNSDVLVAHNAVPESSRGIARHLHMPPSVIGDIASKARVSQLVLSHRMRRTLGKEAETRNIIKKYYQGKVTFADDLDCFAVP